jgi:ribosomal protein S20
MLDVYKKKKETDKDLIEETYNNAVTEAEKLASKGFFKQSLAKKKEDIYKELAKEG